MTSYRNIQKNFWSRSKLSHKEFIMQDVPGSSPSVGMKDYSLALSFKRCRIRSQTSPLILK